MKKDNNGQPVNLAQLKRALTAGAWFEISFPDGRTETRVVNKRDTVSIYSIVPFDAAAKATTDNNGIGSWLQFGKAGFWSFQDGVCALYHSDNVEEQTENTLIFSVKVLSPSPDDVEKYTVWKESLDRAKIEREQAAEEMTIANNKAEIEAITTLIIETMKSSGKVPADETVSIYVGNGAYKQQNVILYLAEKYDVEIPIKTKGWICKCLHAVKIDEKQVVGYWRSGNKSTAIGYYMQKLVNAVNETMPEAESVEFFGGNEMNQNGEHVENSVDSVETIGGCPVVDHITRANKSVPVVDTIPNGWAIAYGALTAPIGYEWITNGKSYFGGERESALYRLPVEIDDAEQDTEAQEMGNGTLDTKQEEARSIKFFYNGIKVNGERALIKCFYILDNRHDCAECVTIYAKSYDTILPGWAFDVENESDSMTDYFVKDHATLCPDHPLYPYARAAALKAEIRTLERYPGCTDIDRISRAQKLEQYRVELRNLPSGHPTTADIATLDAMRLAAETERRAAEQAEAEAKEAKFLAAKEQGSSYIKSMADQYPIKEGEPVVTIEWSEHPAFYDNENIRLSVAAAEIILKHFDDERAEANRAENRGGYDKTSFKIEYTDQNGELSTYEGRYDLGDGDGGMVEHIRTFGHGLRTKGRFGNGKPSDDDKRKGAEIEALADMLANYTANPPAQIVSVSLAPWVESAIEERQEHRKQEVNDLFDMVEMLTDEQLALAVFSAPKDDLTIARFFLQELARRDQWKALKVFRAWRSGDYQEFDLDLD